MAPLRMLVFVVLSLAVSHAAWATPAFARKEQLGCPVCHTAFPELNPAGRTYKENGFRFPAGDGVKTTGVDVGSGIILDPSPGIAIRVDSVPLEVTPDDQGQETATVTLLDSVELIMAGSNGQKWSYLAELGAEAGEEYQVGGNGVVMYRAAKEATAFIGWTPMFSRDDYNSLSESRRVDHVDHAAQDYAGSTDINMNTEGGVAGVFGREGPVFYMAEAGPGPDAAVSTGEPFDYVGRIGVDATKNLELGAFVYYGETASASTVRGAIDANAFAGASTFKLLAMYDTTDSAILGELGWDYVATEKGFWIVPQARVDLTSTPDGTTAVPMAGIGVQQSAGRVQLEVSEPFGTDGAGPTARVIFDTVF
jgi:hypothetical protein